MLAPETSDEHWRAARRERMLDAAASVFSEKGFEAASMDDIAVSASMAKPTLYRYFRSKEALFEAVFINALDLLSEAMDAAAATRSDAAGKLSALVAVLLPTFREHLASLRMMSGASAQVERGRRRIFRERREAIEIRLAKVVASGIDAGAFRMVDPRLTAQLIIGTIWSGSTSGKSDEVLCDAITGFVLAGLDAGAKEVARAER